ncbi:LysR substrate-binding domain-containing protein [Caulobacter endophyticus]|uniref:LysR substrate-binding domain-containing protein n=1 Tax=Caulobacter endophyticus TaxID=2172652 RepID=UPI00240F0FFF|nr:LysR substrate-binding domain-containing protein [Caulobacter endophyticus]MDG2527942.1 LysR substrate-binding domain-containing protein [Caulobacter endophyticus]
MAANYQHLRAFHAIALEGSVTQAARRLNVAQPTLSQQLKALEERHGVGLFESRRSPLKLTSAGRDLFALTERLFSAAADVDDMLGEAVSLNGGSLRIGGDCPPQVARVVARFRARNPGAHVQVRMGNARETIRWLSAAEIDVAIASDPPADGQFIYDPLYTDHLAVALPVGHPLAALETTPIQSLAGETLLIREPQSKTRAFTEQALGAAEVEVCETLELQSRETIREAVALGLGVSVFFSSECPPDPRIAYRTLSGQVREQPLRGYLVCQQDRRRSALIRALRAIASELSDAGVG